MIGIDAAIGGAAVIGDLEGDGGVAVAIGVCCRSEDEIADVADSNDIVVADIGSVEFEGASGGGGGDDDGLEGIVRSVVWICETEVGGLEGV